MKKVIAILALMTVCLAAYATDNTQKTVQIKTVTWVAEGGTTSITVPAGGTVDSDAIKVNYPTGNTGAKSATRGQASLQVDMTGTGTLNAVLLCSNTGANFSVPGGHTTIITGITVGTSFKFINLPACDQYKIRLTETGGAATGTATCTVAQN